MTASRSRTGPGPGVRDNFSKSTERAYAPIREIINRPRYLGKITELSINGPGAVLVRVAGAGTEWLPAREAAFATERFITELCTSMAANLGLKFNPDLPILACRTPDGHRFQAMTGLAVDSGISVSIRIKRMVDATWDDFEVEPLHRDWIERELADGKGVFLSGGTGSGKTTFQNMLGNFVPVDERIFTIEDTREIDLPRHRNKVHLIVSRVEGVSKVTWAHALDHCLRANPDAIWPGELSIMNAFPVLQAMDTGHESIVTTMHANSPLDALRGFRRRVALSGAPAAEVESVMEFLADTISTVVQIKHKRRGDNIERRVVTDVCRPGDIAGQSRVGSLARDMKLRDGVLGEAEAMARLIESNGGSLPSSDTLAVLEVLKNIGILKSAGNGEKNGKLNCMPAPGADKRASLSGEELTMLDYGARAGLDFAGDTGFLAMEG